MSLTNSTDNVGFSLSERDRDRDRDDAEMVGGVNRERERERTYTGGIFLISILNSTSLRMLSESHVK